MTNRRNVCLAQLAAFSVVIATHALPAVLTSPSTYPPSFAWKTAVMERDTLLNVMMETKYLAMDAAILARLKWATPAVVGLLVPLTTVFSSTLLPSLSRRLARFVTPPRSSSTSDWTTYLRTLLSPLIVQTAARKSLLPPCQEVRQAQESNPPISLEAGTHSQSRLSSTAPTSPASRLQSR